MRDGEVDVLLVSPERLNNSVFRDEVLPSLARDAGLVAIDEAHCVSDWGQSIGQPRQGAGGNLRPGDGLRQAGPHLRRARGGALLPGLLLPAGRARGRGVERAEVVLLPGAEDRAIWDWFGTQDFPPEDEVRQVLAGLDAARASGDGVMSTAVLQTLTRLRRTRLESMVKVLDVDGAVRRVRGGWVSTGEPWSYDAKRNRRVEAARLAEQDLMLAYEALEPPGCRIAFLRQALDDPQMTQEYRCGACDLCGGLALDVAAGADEVEAARRSLSRVGVRIEPRRQWPTGMDRLGLDGMRGRIPEGYRAADGLAVGRLDGLGVSGALHELVEHGPGGQADGEVPQALRAPAA